jgi:hypothetical protein
MKLFKQLLLPLTPGALPILPVALDAYLLLALVTRATFLPPLPLPPYVSHFFITLLCLVTYL